MPSYLDLYQDICFCKCVKNTVSLIAFSVCFLFLYKKTTDFYVFILNPNTVFISYRCFLVELLGTFMYKVLSSANKDNLTSSLPICVPLISFICLIAKAEIWNTMLNKYEQTVLTYFTRHSLSFSQFRMMLAVDLL